MKIIGIETSHDDTSIAVIENGEVKVMITYSQIEEHAKFGGVVPEIASREHAMNVAIVLEQIKEKINIDDVDLVAYTKEPGLIGALHMGSLLAHGIAFALEVEIKPINHLTGHIFSSAINHEISYPAIALVVSGGHSQIMLANSPTDIQIVGQTQDDAVGETYDKVARKLELGYPGGPHIDKIAKGYTPTLEFPIPMNDKTLNLSFSGLKSHVINYIHNNKQKGIEIDKKEIAAAFQIAAVTSLMNKTKLAIKKYNPKCIILAGGVSANSMVREKFVELHENAIIPNLKYATDNGAMIAKTAEILYSK
ncbi:tRNA (adenosine(37)-N6)-threonylcarbamoyltransferase complex transferase subunit TsaD [Mycoplasma marinum]|uniref:tRNA N6-adenosine threonylcarbamoyltransferase n=1 Tax=Mycoplasma marinum TaxID=1937190 RepID=A0A4R0XSW3_9MOLU|nr:tRNA (adenosine(37)-N6)-threonylcarbamoyltransferase complex transferase subunit TsaD [Mycoplasma marinum]TCG10817.1 tRNA (adenosine(37)-N6)-threonylcarbamoyltransferase complex transferase subunit TsaD [Mycoplasma marinum]